jgi:hypothetical protein
VLDRVKERTMKPWCLLAWIGSAAVAAGGSGLRAGAAPTVPKFGWRETMPVDKLPTGYLRQEWEVVRARHPHAKLPGWVLRMDWGLARGRIGSSRRRCFVRICPENGAQSLDWGEAELSRTDIERYSQGVGPDRLPKELLEVPRLTVVDAWSRVLQALLVRGAKLPSVNPPPQHPLLRLMAEKQQIRMVYEFAPGFSDDWVCVDTTTGEVGGVIITFQGDGPGHRDSPLDVLPPQWVSTEPPVP